MRNRTLFLLRFNIKTVILVDIFNKKKKNNPPINFEMFRVVFFLSSLVFSIFIFSSLESSIFVFYVFSFLNHQVLFVYKKINQNTLFNQL